MLEQVSERLRNFRDEVETLRAGCVLPGPHTSPQDVLNCLLDVRQRLDRTEELYRLTLMLRNAVHRSWTTHRHAVEDAWDTAATESRKGAVRDEYSSAKERQAMTNLAVLDLRRSERELGDAARVADEHVETIRLMHRGLADIRQDVLAILRAQQFESTLDR